MIENRIARLDIAQKIDQRNLICLRTRKRAHDEIEISRGKPRPTIRPDHRDFIMGDGCADGKPDSNGRAIFARPTSELYLPCGGSIATGLPVAVGFGISTPEQVRSVWRFADAAVVGSAIVSEIENLRASPDLVKRIGEFARSLVAPAG